MTERDMIRMDLAVRTGNAAMAVQALENELQQSRQLLTAMADMIRTTNERMAALEQAVRTLEKVTPAQAAAVNRAVRERAKAVCAEYLADGCEREAAAAIRRSVRERTGARSAREIARCDYPAVMEQVRTWDEYRVMKTIRKKGARG